MADNLPVAPVLLGELPVLGEYGIVVVGGHVGGQGVVVVGTVHKPKVGAALEHVDVHMAQPQHGVQVLVAASLC